MSFSVLNQIAMTKLRYGTVCTGIGGFDLGLDAAGMECAWMVEIDPRCREVLARHWSMAKRFQDMREVGGHNLDTVDVLAGGTPCQGFSVAGLRGSLDDDRSNLAFQFCRIANELDPSIVLWENVPGVLSTKDNAFGCFLAGLVGADAPLVPAASSGRQWTDAGLVVGPRRCAAWCIKDAQYFGTPQRRKRVFVVAGATAECVSQILLERESLCGHSAESREAGQSPSSEAGSGTQAAGGGLFGSDGSGDRDGGAGCLTPWLPMRTRIHDAAGVCKQSWANSSGGGHGVPTLAIEQEKAYTLKGSGGWKADGADNQIVSPVEDYVPKVHGVVNMQGAKGSGVVTDEDISYTLNAMHGHDVHAVCYDMTHADDVIREVAGGIAPTLQARMGTGGNQRDLVATRPRVSVEHRNADCAVTDQGGITATLRAGTEHSNQFIMLEDDTLLEPNKLAHITSFGEYVEDVPSSTVLSRDYKSATDLIVRSMVIRRLTPVECELLQGFPPDHTAWRITKPPAGTVLTPAETELWNSSHVTPMSDSTRYKMCGNAVNVAVSTWLALRLYPVLCALKGHSLQGAALCNPE